MRKNFLIFGDSIVYGILDKEYGGWAQRLRLFIENKEGQLVSLFHILGISGESSSELLGRIEFEIVHRLDQKRETIVIISVGINDSCFIKKEGRIMTPPQKFRHNVKELIKISKKYSSRIIFIGLTPVEEIKVSPYPLSSTGKIYNNQSINKYNNIIREECLRSNIHFIEIFNKFESLNYKELLADGLHPNPKGHQKIFEIVKEYLTKNGIINEN